MPALLPPVQRFEACGSAQAVISVDCPENGVDDEEEKQLSAYQLVQRPLPLEEKPREASRCGRGHVPLIRDSHLCTLKIS